MSEGPQYSKHYDDEAQRRDNSIELVQGGQQVDRVTHRDRAVALTRCDFKHHRGIAMPIFFTCQISPTASRSKRRT